MDNSDSMAWLVAILAIFWWLLQLMRGKGRWEINVTLISLFGCSVLIQQQQFIASRQHLSPFEELGNRSLPTLGYVHSALSPMLFDQSQSTPPPRRQKFSDVDTAASRCEYAPKIVHVSDSLVDPCGRSISRPTETIPPIDAGARPLGTTYKLLLIWLPPRCLLSSCPQRQCAQLDGPSRWKPHLSFATDDHALAHGATYTICDEKPNLLRLPQHLLLESITEYLCFIGLSPTNTNLPDDYVLAHSATLNLVGVGGVYDSSVLVILLYSAPTQAKSSVLRSKSLSASKPALYPLRLKPSFTILFDPNRIPESIPNPQPPPPVQSLSFRILNSASLPKRSKPSLATSFDPMSFLFRNLVSF